MEQADNLNKKITYAKIRLGIGVILLSFAILSVFIIDVGSSLNPDSSTTTLWWAIAITLLVIGCIVSSRAFKLLRSFSVSTPSLIVFVILFSIAGFISILILGFITFVLIGTILPHPGVNVSFF